MTRRRTKACSPGADGGNRGEVDRPSCAPSEGHPGDWFLDRREMALANREWLLVFRAEQVRQREEDLQSRERQLKRTLEAVGDGLWEWDAATGQLRLGQRYFTMLGYEPDEVPATFATWQHLVHPDDLERALAFVNGNHDTSATFTVSFRMRARTGEWRHILGRGKVVCRDARGSATRAVGTHTDLATLMAPREESSAAERTRGRSFTRGSPDPEQHCPSAATGPGIVDTKLVERRE